MCMLWSPMCCADVQYAHCLINHKCVKAFFILDLTKCTCTFLFCFCLAAHHFQHDTFATKMSAIYLLIYFKTIPFYFYCRLSHAQRSAVKVLRRMQYFVARRKFQVRRKTPETKTTDTSKKGKNKHFRQKQCVVL